MASKDFEKLLELLENRPDATDATYLEWREGMEAAAPKLALPDGVRCEPVDMSGVPGEWTIPNSAGDRTVLYFHGGGYALGSIATHRHMAALLAEYAEARCLSVDYRLGPEHRFPAAIEDGVAAYRWLLSSGISADRVVIAGDSAGGGLTMATTLSLRDAGDPLPAGCVCLSPWVDLEGTGDSMTSKADEDIIVGFAALKRMADWYLDGHDPRDPLASPIYADLSGLPPIFIQVGSAETLLDDSTRLEQRARDAGVEVECEVWDEMLHVWQYYAPILVEGRDALEKIGAFVKRRVPD